MPGVKRAERHFRDVPALAEEDVAVQVPVIVLRRVFIRTESCELAGMVVLVGDLNIFLPNGAGHLWCHEGLDRRTASEAKEVQEGGLDLCRIIWVVNNQTLRLRHLAHRRAWRVRLFRDTHVLGVVGYSHEVHGRVDFDVVTERMLDRLALRILEGLVWTGEAVPEQPGIH